jgi:hypothetical protein
MFVREKRIAEGFRPEWGNVLRGLEQIHAVAISKDGQQVALRTPSTGVIGLLFKAAPIARPTSATQVQPDRSTPAQHPPV